MIDGGDGRGGGEGGGRGVCGCVREEGGRGAGGGKGTRKVPKIGK